ncbi:MAG: CRTAC1 family protein [Acidobacteriota bacterium]
MIARGPLTRRTQRRILYACVTATAGAALLLLRGPRVIGYTPGVEAASSDEITHDLARPAPNGIPDVAWRDVAADAGIAFHHFHGKRSTQLPEDMGSGVAWGDYDGDGDPDLFLVNESGPLTATAVEIEASPARSALYRNDGGRFTDVTTEAGVGARGLGMGAAWGDADGDGDLDLAVSRFGTIALYRNDGATFADVSRESGMGEPEGFWTGVSWGDYDRDGALDLYVCGYVRYVASASGASRMYEATVPASLNPSSFTPERNLLFHNEGRMRFAESAARAGVDNPSGRSLSAAWADFDGDLWPDLYVANDISDNAMYRNVGDGTFEDVSHSAWVADYRGAMGLAIGDWDGDLDLDIFITHWIAQENALYVNQKGNIAASPRDPLHFTDEADLVGLGQIALDYVGWGTEFLDYDNDARLDLLVVNGSTFQREDDASRLVPMKDLLFWNAGKAEGFFEAGTRGGAPFQTEHVGRGSACADYDGDGDVDCAIAVNGGDARLLQNTQATGHHFARLVLRGAKGSHFPASTTFANGALVTLRSSAGVQVRAVGGGPSYLSQSSPGEVHFGLAGASSIDRIEVAWPSGTTQSFENLPVDHTLRITEGNPAIEVAGAAPPHASRAGKTYGYSGRGSTRRRDGARGRTSREPRAPTKRPSRSIRGTRTRSTTSASAARSSNRGPKRGRHSTGWCW